MLKNLERLHHLNLLYYIRGDVLRTFQILKGYNDFDATYKIV